jgi:NAD(P)-dependent dehydrogenase (short-subunit alcohol dehydrogenase family)
VANAGVAVHHHEAGDSAERTAQAVRDAGQAALVVHGDVTNAEDVARMTGETASELGSFDVLVHTPGMVLKKPMADITDDEFDTMMAVNARSTFLVLREAARKMADQGRVIALSTSLTSVTTGLYTVYAGAKAPVEQFCKMLAHEVGERGITVNAVAPGPIESTFFHGQETDESTAFFGTLTPFGRLGVWPEIVPTIAFLATPDAHWITGQTIRINGGMSSLV